MDIRVVFVNQMDQNSIKLNNIMEETNSVLSWRKCMWKVTEEQQCPDDSYLACHMVHACAPCACYLQCLQFVSQNAVRIAER